MKAPKFDKQTVAKYFQSAEGYVQKWLSGTSESRVQWIMKRIRVKDWPTSPFRLPAWQAHRGYWRGGQVQNSLAALRAAKSHGAPMVEFDVRLTADRIPILFHNPSWIDANGESHQVHLSTHQEISSVIEITRLSEVLESPNIPRLLNIELKSERILEESLERYVVQVVEEFSAQDRVMFSSFNPISLWKVSQYLPKVPRGLLVSSDLSERSLRELWWSLLLPIHALHLEDQMISGKTMQNLGNQGVPVAAWTINNHERMNELWNQGVASIITDEIPKKVSASDDFKTV